MVFDFMVQHPSGPFFRLNEVEWNNARREYPDLDDDGGLRYEKYSATAMAYLGSDPYFDNRTILQQFRRLFQLLKYKKEYENHRIEILVDNARTHTAKPFSVNDFGKRIGSRCPIKEIEYVSLNNRKEIVECYFTSGLNVGKSKGLFVIALELGLSVPPSIKLKELKNLLEAHPAFKCVSHSHALFISTVLVSDSSDISTATTSTLIRDRHHTCT